MKKFLVLIFLLVLLVAGVVAFRYYYAPIEIPKETLLSVCYGLDLEQCEGVQTCRPKYNLVNQNACPRGKICTTEFKFPRKEFLYCEKIPSKELELAKKSKELCVGEYAKWSDNQKPGRCFCGYADFTNEQREFHGHVDFVENYGCITARELCEKLGGTFEPDPSNGYEWCAYPDGFREHVDISETSKKLDF